MQETDGPYTTEVLNLAEEFARYRDIDDMVVEAGKDVVSVAGTGSGADTVLLVHSENSKDFFEARIKEVVAKPAKKENLKF